ncbi:hypothetical protein [Pokkaliibacter plantistimulans]|nr:hypothetical protein [Pokkaliibacter plantistimulans]
MATIANITTTPIAKINYLCFGPQRRAIQGKRLQSHDFFTNDGGLTGESQ